MSNRPWTTLEDRRLVELFPYFRTADVAKKLGRSKPAVDRRARRYNLKKHPDFVDEGNRFMRGNKPWNLGKKHDPAGSAAGRFKPGMTPHNKASIGAEKLVHGVLRRKVRDTGKFFTDWRPVKDIVWTAHHGPIPAGAFVSVIDGDHTNVHIDNLLCQPRSERIRGLRNAPISATA